MIIVVDGLLPVEDGMRGGGLERVAGDLGEHSNLFLKLLTWELLFDLYCITLSPVEVGCIRDSDCLESLVNPLSTEPSRLLRR